MQIKIGIVGVGAFSQNFIPLFKAHPLVGEVVLCDQNQDLLRKNAEKHGIKLTSPSLDHLCGTDVDAIVIMTQNWLHGPQAVQALKAGKHVYSAVPAGISMEEITTLVRTVEETGNLYMIGETSYYYPSAIYCREKFKRGEFGHIVYGESEYYHDWDHGLYAALKNRGGDNWKQFAGSPPMHYPTHTTSYITSVTGAYMTHVSSQGFVDRHEDGLYLEHVNQWGNTFSNESALFKMSDGSTCRINEFRRIGHPGTCRMSLFGTEGSFEENTAGSIWLTKKYEDKQRLDDLLACGKNKKKIDHDQQGMEVLSEHDDNFYGVAPIHDVSRLPKEFTGLPNGHLGSHQFLVDDFVKACVSGDMPPNHVWDAARYVIPGLVAHESAIRGGVLLEIPDLGSAPVRRVFGNAATANETFT